MIDRPDWNFEVPEKQSGGELGFPDKPAKSDAPAKLLEAKGESKGKAVAKAEPSGKASRPDFAYDHDGREIVTKKESEVDAQDSDDDGETATGLEPRFIQELAALPGGYEANLDAIKDVATMHLQNAADPQAFAEHFDTLSAGLQTKAYRAMLRHPKLSLPDLLDHIETKLTLDEMVEAEQWVRAVKKQGLNR